MSRTDHTLRSGRDRTLVRLARNVGTRYLAIAVDALIGLAMLPFNLSYLGQSEWGLWMLTASLTIYFSALDLGYGGATVRFVAHYRARGDVRALNEVLSTMFAFCLAVGVVAYAVVGVVAWQFGAIFNVEPAQVETGRIVLLILGLYVALGFPFGVFGGVMNGFQRYDLNNVVGVGTSVIAAAVNVAVLWMGYGLVELVAATTAVRMGAYLLYRLNAYRVFPELSVQPMRARLSRLKEIGGFSVYMAILDWSNKLNYSIDPVIIGALMSPAAVALWMVPRRAAEFLLRLTNQLNSVLFPVVVDSHAGDQVQRLRLILLHGTRLSLISVAPIATALCLLAEPLLTSWVGPDFTESAVILQVLAVVTAVRVGAATGTTVLKGGGHHRLLAFTNATTAAVNVGLTLLLIRPFGLVGVAAATFVSITTAAVFVLWPAACRRVGVRVGQALRQAVWPAVWPVAPMVLVIVVLRGALPTGLVWVALMAVAGGATYLATFLLFGVTRAERRVYVSKAYEIAGWRRGVPAAA